MKYEVKEYSATTYGIWNNDMCAFQYVEFWNGLDTTDIDEAHEQCQRFNSGHYN